MFDSHNAIEARGLVKTYPGDVRALDGLDLEVEAGTVFGLLGPNGAGKSTTVRILTTLSRPDAGSARVAGLDVLAEPVRVRHAIGVVGQKHGVDPDASGRENLVIQGEFYGITGAALRRRVAESLERFGLAEAGARQVKTYSGGMQRRLDVAMGLIHRPQVLFLDEPTTGLDPEARAQMWAEIERLAREEGMTILLTTHYLEEADRLASQLAIVDRGRIVARGTPDALKSELRGDTIQVELAGDDGAAAVAALERLAEARDVALDGRDAARPGGRRRRRGAGRARSARGARRPGGGGDARAAVAGRRLPALCGAFVRARRRGGGMTALRQTWQVALRYLRVIARQPAFLFIALVQPIIWLLLFGALFKAVSEIPGFSGGSYIDFLTPGRGRDAGRVERRLDRDGLHRGHQQRRDGPHARLAGVARRAEPRQRRAGGDPDPRPDAADRAARARAGRALRERRRRRPRADARRGAAGRSRRWRGRGRRA